jgi:hypothetical protein
MAVLPDWPSLAGTQLSRIAVPVGICGTAAGNSLVLRALSWEWMAEIRRHRDALLSRINKARPEQPFAGLTILNPDAKLVSCPGPRGGKSA